MLIRFLGKIQKTEEKKGCTSCDKSMNISKYSKVQSFQLTLPTGKSEVFEKGKSYEEIKKDAEYLLSLTNYIFEIV